MINLLDLDSEQKCQPRPLNEAKLLVVGSEAVGKTSLIRYLTKDEARDPDEKKTQGTDIRECIDISKWTPDASGMRVNIWDFGGQEIMHGTHRYFMTRRSLYLIVLEDRKEKDNDLVVYQWLSRISSRAGDSPIIVIINKSDNGKEDLKLSQERIKHENPSIVAFHRTSCDADGWAKKSIEALRLLIAKTIKEHASLAEIRNPVPASWLWVRNEISHEVRKNKRIKIINFTQLCRNIPETVRASDQNLIDANDQRNLLDLLCDLGVIVAYSDDSDVAVKRHKVLIDPNWLTDAIYTILNHKTLKEQKGIFLKEQLPQLLPNQKIYPSNCYNFILKVMQNKSLGLCLMLDGTQKQFLVPEQLPEETDRVHHDDFCWTHWRDYHRVGLLRFRKATCLRFRYRYKELLPRGLIAHFIATAHSQLTKVRWRFGALFYVEQCRVLVSADCDNRVVDILVNGPYACQRNALNIIRDDLERVHKFHGNSGIEARVPLPEQPTIDERYEHLERLELLSGSDYLHQPTGAARRYKVRELLDPVRRENTIAQARSEKDFDAKLKELAKQLRDFFTGRGAWPRFILISCLIAIAFMVMLCPDCSQRLNGSIEEIIKLIKTFRK